MSRRTVVIVVSACLFLSVAASAQQVDPELLAGIKARSIGPAGMSGRTAAVDALASDPDTIYVGGASGGVWKSTNGGLNWQPVFDDQPVAAIGAIAINQGNPDIVWVGTGEGNPRNSSSVGNGMYRSLDAGRTWTHIGLEDSERIHRILLDPSDPEAATVCAMGKAWNENEQRGVFHTDDGGATWQKVLYVDPRTGCADLAQDPANPAKFIAAMWDYRRWPWFFRSGGPGSGLFLTVDGGKNWKRLTPEDGLPQGEIGRIGVAFSPSRPEIVYAIVEAKKYTLLRSNDGGHSWKDMKANGNLGSRPFYFADLRVDPEYPDRVYSLHGVVTVSDDGGRNWSTLIPFRSLHPDHHGMWINPRDGRHMIATNDGGVGISNDRGQNWRFVRNLPLAQFYHIRVDNDVPYNVYGGLQDNGSWRGPSSVWEAGLSSGIRNFHWQMLHFGDGFDTVPDPEDSMRGYAMSQGGDLSRWNLHTGEDKAIRPPEPDDVRLRFNWNAGIAQDPFDPATIYFGSQFLHKSTDRGDTWETISGDLTSNNPEWQKQDESGGLTLDVTHAENFTTIITIEPSAVERGVLWVGTDDGRVHVTRDGGANWQSVEGNVKGVPANTWVPHITPSRFDAGTAFVVFDNHRRSDWTPYVFKTTNFGRSWTPLATEGVRGYALKIEQDPVEKDLLFLGTEFALYFSLDGGKSWQQWKHGLPTASIMDMAIQPRDNDLVIGTHGRAAYIIDDISPLRSLTAKTLSQPLHLFPVAGAQQHEQKQSPGELMPGAGEYRGANRPYGALVTFSVSGEGIPHPNDEIERERKATERAGEKEESGDKTKEMGDETKREAKAEIRIADASGATIRKWKADVRLGLNRVVWNLRRDSFRRPGSDPFAEFFGAGGPEVLPGDYTVTVNFRGQESSQPLQVLADPRIEISRADREANFAALMRAGHAQETIARAVQRIQRTREDIQTVSRKLKERDADAETVDDKDSPNKALIKEGEKLGKTLTELEKRLWQTPDTEGIPPENDALSKVGDALRSIQSSWEAPTPAQLNYLRQAEELLREILKDFNETYATQVAGFRAKVREAGLDLLPEADPVSYE